MSGAPQLKYTDRDVRDDPSLMDLAIGYILNYTGEFEPLVEAKEFFAEEDNLPVPMARKVLNCMRHDRDWFVKLPAPERREVVVQFRPPRDRRRKVHYDKQQCADAKSHGYHHWGIDNAHTCEGVPYAINRGRSLMEVRVKVPYVAAKGGKLIHDVHPDMSMSKTSWEAPAHEWGFGHEARGRDWLKSDASLHVKLLCRFPSYLIDPYLLRVDDVEPFLKAQRVLTMPDMKMCPHCAKLRTDR